MYFLRSTCTAVLRVGLGPLDRFFCPNDIFFCPDDIFFCPDNRFFCPDDSFLWADNFFTLSDNTHFQFFLSCRTRIFVRHENFLVGQPKNLGRQKKILSGQPKTGRGQTSPMSRRDSACTTLKKLKHLKKIILK